MMAAKEVRDIKDLLVEWGVTEEKARDAAFYIAYGFRMNSIYHPEGAELPSLRKVLEQI